MTITAQSIVKTAQQQLQDESGIRWPAAELVESLNAGQRDISMLRPDMMAMTAALALVSGAKQTVPAGCSKLIEVPRNTLGAAIRQVERNLLDAVEPGWYTKPGTKAIKHFTHDPREPNVFYVYPPAALGASVDLVYAALPADVPAATGQTFTGVTGNISVPDVFANALLHFCLFRSYAKDAEFGGNTALSAAHYQLFKTGLSEDITTRQAVKPTVTDSAQ